MVDIRHGMYHQPAQGYGSGVSGTGHGVPFERETDAAEDDYGGASGAFELSCVGWDDVVRVGVCVAAVVVDVLACGADKIQIPGLGLLDAREHVGYLVRGCGVAAEEVFEGEVAKRSGGDEGSAGEIAGV